MAGLSRRAFLGGVAATAAGVLAPTRSWWFPGLWTPRDPGKLWAAVDPTNPTEAGVILAFEDAEWHLLQFVDKELTLDAERPMLIPEASRAVLLGEPPLGLSRKPSETFSATARWIEP